MGGIHRESIQVGNPNIKQIANLAVYDVEQFNNVNYYPYPTLCFTESILEILRNTKCRVATCARRLEIGLILITLQKLDGYHD